MTASLIPDETLARVGELLAEPVTVVIDRRESQRYALAVGDANPVYFDEAAAVAAGHRTIIAPPTFVTHAIVPPRPNSDLREDGLWRDGTGVRLEVARMMEPSCSSTAQPASTLIASTTTGTTPPSKVIVTSWSMARSRARG